MKNKTKLELKSTEIPGIKVGIKKDGRQYSVRDDRSRYFFPDEWNKFYNNLRDKNKLIFDVLIQTGARIDEALHITPNDINTDRNIITIRVTKVKSKIKERVGKSRTFEYSKTVHRKLKRYIQGNNISPQEKIFKMSSEAVYGLLKRNLKKAGIKDVYNFSLHNIRKTHGMWLKSLKISVEEICLRLGHNFDTYLKHYGSPSIFERKDKLEMINILGGIYELK